MAQHTLQQKIDALKQLEESPDDIAAVSKQVHVSVAKLRQWRRDSEAIHQAHRRQQQEQAAQIMSDVQVKMAETSLTLMKAITDADRIAKAPLNQLAAALGVL